MFVVTDKFKRVIYKIMKQNSVHASILLFVISSLFIYHLRPRAIFSPDGSMRELGVSRPHTTLCPFWLVSICLALISYLFFYTRPIYTQK